MARRPTNPHNSTPSSPRFLPVGDTALSVEFGNTIDPGINDRVVAFDRAVRAAGLPGVLETVPSYRALLVEYEPRLLSFSALVAFLLAMDQEAGGVVLPPRRWVVPVAYGDEFGEDLAEVARRRNLSPEAVIAAHVSGAYRVYMIGFAPGFAYLGRLPATLQLPRRETPRQRVAEGSVMIGGLQTAVAPMAIPTGWHVLGRTPLRCFDMRKPDPFLFRPGDRVRFRPIGLLEFERLSAHSAAGGLAATLEA